MQVEMTWRLAFRVAAEFLLTPWLVMVVLPLLVSFVFVPAEATEFATGPVLPILGFLAVVVAFKTMTGKRLASRVRVVLVEDALPSFRIRSEASFANQSKR